MIVGGGNDWYGPQWSRDELTGPLPTVPEFNTPLEVGRERIARTIGKVTIPREVKIWHPAIQRLLKEDGAWREKLRKYSYSWHKPIFATGDEAAPNGGEVFLAIRKFSGKAFQTKTPRRPAAPSSNNTLSLHSELEAVFTRPERGYHERSAQARAVFSYHSEREVRSWHDEAMVLDLSAR